MNFGRTDDEAFAQAGQRVRTPLMYVLSTRHYLDHSKMSKPIGYFTSVMPGDGSYLDELQQQYGSTFEKLGRTEKILILVSVVQNLLQAEIASHGFEPIAESMALASSITPGIRESVKISEHLGLAEALINQLKYQR